MRPRAHAVLRSPIKIERFRGVEYKAALVRVKGRLSRDERNSSPDINGHRTTARVTWLAPSRGPACIAHIVGATLARPHQSIALDGQAHVGRPAFARVRTVSDDSPACFGLLFSPKHAQRFPSPCPIITYDRQLHTASKIAHRAGACLRRASRVRSFELHAARRTAVWPRTGLVGNFRIGASFSASSVFDSDARKPRSASTSLRRERRTLRGKRGSSPISNRDAASSVIHAGRHAKVPSSWCTTTNAAPPRLSRRLTPTVSPKRG